MLFTTSALALGEAERIGATGCVGDVYTAPFRCTVTRKQYERMLRPYVSVEDLP